MTVRPLGQANVPAAQRLAAVLAQLERIVVGKSDPLKLALACLLARGHLLIEDIPGVGKSTLAQALAATLGLKYARVQFTSDLLPADVLGVSIFDAPSQSFRFHSGPGLQFGRAGRRDQPCAAEDAERAPRGDGGAAGVAGRRDAPAARAVLRDRDAEPGRADRRLSAARVAARPLPDGDRARLPGPGRRARTPDRRRPARADRHAVRRSADPPTLLEWQREAANVHVAPALLDYVQALLAATRGNVGSGADAGARRGLSPRAGLLLLAAARAWALLAGRPMVVPEDVQAVFPSVAGHRLAGGARTGALQAQSLLRTIALP